MKCKKKREMKNIKKSKTSRGITMNKGTCLTCNTKMCKLGDK